jgi:hypothetical protein
MAYSSTGLNVASASKAGNAPQIWTYKTTDLITAVDASGYFNSAASLLKVGDLMYVHANSAGTTPTFGFVIVTGNTTAGVVDVTNATALGTIDSD